MLKHVLHASLLTGRNEKKENDNKKRYHLVDKMKCTRPFEEHMITRCFGIVVANNALRAEP